MIKRRLKTRFRHNDFVDFGSVLDSFLRHALASGEYKREIIPALEVRMSDVDEKGIPTICYNRLPGYTPLRAGTFLESNDYEVIYRKI